MKALVAPSIPDSPPADIVAWAEESVKVDGHSFDRNLTPQLIEPLKSMADNKTRIGTLIKPVQSGGSTIGEVVCAYWAAFRWGLIQFNWQDGKVAEKRWHDRIKKTLGSCCAIKRSGERFEEVSCLAQYLSSTVRVQGVFTEGALDSDTVPMQINEEVHLWAAGFLGKARRRQTRVWDSKALDISNAGNTGGQLESAFLDGTQEAWQVLCPSCGQFHEMQFRWNPDKPELGGLRWDSDGCKQDNGLYDYNKLEATIRYQFPCGHTVKDHAAERRKLSLSGRYVAKNPGAHISHRSWNFEAVSCDCIRWITIIKEWHGAIRALKVGDREPMRRFVTERECRFFSDESIPYSGTTIYNTNLKKNREGLPGRAMRIATADWQQGYKAKGELQHYWLMIEDVMPNCDSQIVFEGKVESDTELLGELDAHQVPRSSTWIDCSKNTKAILQLCYQNGMNAINLQLSRLGSFLHADKVRRFYSEDKPIHKELNVVPVFEPVPKRNPRTGQVDYSPHPLEPVVVSMNKAGALSNHFFIRDMQANVLAADPQATPDKYIRVDIPSDVSEEFKRQNESWQRLPSFKPKANEPGLEGFKQRSRVDHLLMCRAYADFLKEYCGLLGERLSILGLSPAEQPEQENDDGKQNDTATEPS